MRAEQCFQLSGRRPIVCHDSKVAKIARRHFDGDGTYDSGGGGFDWAEVVQSRPQTQSGSESDCRRSELGSPSDRLNQANRNSRVAHACSRRPLARGPVGGGVASCTLYGNASWAQFILQSASTDVRTIKLFFSGNGRRTSTRLDLCTWCRKADRSP
jgi:hypothetical protein